MVDAAVTLCETIDWGCTPFLFRFFFVVTRRFRLFFSSLSYTLGLKKASGRTIFSLQWVSITSSMGNPSSFSDFLEL